MKNSMLLIAAALLASCGSSNDNNTTTSQLTFKGNGNPANGAVFGGAHAGQTVRAALLDGTTVLDIQKSTVAPAGTDPAFSFTFTPAIDTAKPYTVNYWIDSNFLIAPAGKEECNPPANDHQWSVPIPAGQTTFTDVHRPASTQDVCSTFTFALTFVADASYVGPHHDQTYHVGIVEESEAKAEDVKTGPVGNVAGSPGISVTFGRKLLINEPAAVKLWIDSNFPPGGTAGVCDVPAVDHQWSFDIQTSLANHPSTLTTSHNAAITTNVCSFFP